MENGIFMCFTRFSSCPQVLHLQTYVFYQVFQVFLVFSNYGELKYEKPLVIVKKNLENLEKHEQTRENSKIVRKRKFTEDS